MRDVIITLIVFWSLPMIFKKPYWGTIMWIWISVMNPHSQGWGFARSYPFAQLIAGTTILSLLLTKQDKKFPMTGLTMVFLAFVGWMSVSQFFAIHPDSGFSLWVRAYKIFAMTIVVIMLTKERRHIELMIISIVFSLGFYGVKGGIFTITSGGNFRVWGPEGTFIEGNNELALGLVTVIPLMYFVMSLIKNRWGRYGMMASMFLCALAALGSYSRGAALAIAAMAVLLWLKSKNKVTLGVIMCLAIPVLLLLMPHQWFERVDTINDYKTDSSAMGRINAWYMAFNLAKDHPFVGGGFDIYSADVFRLYAPEPLDIHAAHSLYFQVMGEHGFVGFFLYLLLGFLTWRTGSWIIRHTKGHEELKWAGDLAGMAQVSLIGFGVGGAFLSLLYFDVPYFIMGALISTRVVVERELLAKKRAAAAPRPVPDDAAMPAPPSVLLQPREFR
jgi:putative inorganic carbon (HCO3(-)) transporter